MKNVAHLHKCRICRYALCCPTRVSKFTDVDDGIFENVLY
jgi:hypothetical protein